MRKYYNGALKAGLLVTVLCLGTQLGTQAVSAQTPVTYDTLGFKTATSKLVLENCPIEVTTGNSLEDQLSACKALIPDLQQMRANFVGEGFEQNLRWADDRVNWQTGNIYRNMALKIINSGQGLNTSSCGYVYTWKSHLLAMDENPREYFTRYDTMLETANGAIEKCKNLGHVTALN